jgi:hypothetical protein
MIFTPSSKRNRKRIPIRDWKGAERLALHPNAQEHTMKEDEGKERLKKAVAEFS